MGERVTEHMGRNENAVVGRSVSEASLLNFLRVSAQALGVPYDTAQRVFVMHARDQAASTSNLTLSTPAALKRRL